MEENPTATTTETTTKETESFAHYRRHHHRHLQARQIKLGPYLLLQTLGEGEFGKVKLGIHTETGQEFAIKLIRKETVGFSASRLSKVEREIHALRTLKHPYIVKLFNVIETERYIGIILEYASGGELFEYILAHRCLKEKDAQRLFAQLISSVQYMHRKRIVHRDLKLENLLLDRNRNIVVTDFGFANNKQDGLMATSCGSPCYAAPELVVNEGMYAGSAVDIWSCGVILYAMLCGYLPFDDDPCNPDSNNINQLYRYILSTPPTFPKHVTQDAQDLLRHILVANPEKRITLDEIQQHPWLKQYYTLFEKSDQELEAEATVMAEQSFMPSYRKAIWSAVKTENIVVLPDTKTTEVEKEGKQGGGEEVKKRKRHGEEWNGQQLRTVTVHGAIRRFNMHRNGPHSTYDRSRKTRTVIEEQKEQPITKPTPPPRRERLLSFFTGKTDSNSTQQQQQPQQQQPQEENETGTTDETLPVPKLRSKFIASLRVRRKDGFEEGGIDMTPTSHPQENTASLKKSSSISIISATMGTHNRSSQQQEQQQPPPSQEQENTSSSGEKEKDDNQQQKVQQQQPSEEKKTIVVHRQESLHASTRAKTRGQRPRYHSTLGGPTSRRAIAAVRNSIYRKTTTAATSSSSTTTANNHPNKPPTSDPVWPPQRHSMDASALLRDSPIPESNDHLHHGKNTIYPSSQSSHRQQQGLDTAIGMTTTHQQVEEKSVSKKMMAWIKRKSQGT
ncbi:kinase-like domain-containing protein [Phascolomyces articulosus]|uniref:Kinase-like domain-containing protein n=1 Tax=Phascolomyces articulosus TaxID=60185 RepID=A0AAD5PJL5_9FUNG|nr:kinase-like domain-containing protein [Phascolomyces articulosus]